VSEANTTDAEYYLGFYTQDDAEGVRRLHTPIPLTQSEFEAIAQAAQAIARCEPSFQYLVMERNYRGMVDAFRFASRIIAMGHKFSNLHPRDQAFAASSSVVNWLTAVKLFLEHTETDLNRRFGAESPEFARFKKVTAEQYDLQDKPGYRFTYKFRNYVQHCGLPISSIEGHADEAQGPPSQVVRLMLARDELLSDYDDGWGPVKRDIAAMDEKFSLLPLAADAMNGLRAVHHELLSIELDAAVATIGTLRDALSRLEASGYRGKPVAVAIADRDDDKMSHTDCLLPVDAIATFSEVADGVRTPESLFQRGQSDEDPSASEDVAEHFSQDHRGAQVLAAWVAQGGLTDEYFRFVNDLVAADGDINPVLGGVVDTSVVLLHMLALALGTSAEALLASFLRPGEQSDPAVN
jgi:hypothetical protein